MLSITKIALLLASAAALVSAGPTPSPEVAERALHKRNGWLYCGGFASADYYNGQSLMKAMSFSSNVWNVPGRSCKRVACENTSAVYVCNDAAGSLNVQGYEIAKHVDPMATKCCIHNKNGATDNKKQSGGQQFTDALGGNWNVITAYGNCNHADTQVPSSYNGGTVNGIGCLPAQFYIS